LTSADYRRLQAQYKIKEFATGGIVGGTGTRDTVPAMLTPGEVVLNRQAVQNLAQGKAGNTIYNIDLTGAVVTNDLINTLVNEVQRVTGRRSELNYLGVN
jgi:hypothetical protein